MTDEELNAIKARLAAACPGPWKGFTFRRPIDGNCYVLVREDDPRTVAAMLVPQYGDNDTAVMLLHSRADMDALVAEVERLRTLLTVDVMHAYEEGVAEGERRIVAYLRRETYPCCGQCNNQLADYIERGDHLKEDA